MKAPHDWITPDWPAPAAVQSLITTRNGGVSTGNYASFNLDSRSGDEQDAVRANRRQLRALLPQEPRWLLQVHGARVINSEDSAANNEADASIARTRGTVCAVMIADCLPVLLCSDSGSVVGIVHAGWRGLSVGVIENTVRAMKVPPSELLTYLGPAIGPGAFEVGPDVRDAFMASDSASAVAFQPAADGKWRADLFELARQRLSRSGVHRVFGGGACTYSDPKRFYSYRRDKITGRMAALIWLEPRAT